MPIDNLENNNKDLIKSSSTLNIIKIRMKSPILDAIKWTENTSCLKSIIDFLPDDATIRKRTNPDMLLIDFGDYHDIARLRKNGFICFDKTDKSYKILTEFEYKKLYEQVSVPLEREGFDSEIFKIAKKYNYILTKKEVNLIRDRVLIAPIEEYEDNIEDAKDSKEYIDKINEEFDLYLDFIKTQNKEKKNATI